MSVWVQRLEDDNDRGTMKHTEKDLSTATCPPQIQMDRPGFEPRRPRWGIAANDVTAR
jgi:hypothetical protein